MVLLRLFTRTWILTTLLVIAAIVVLARLGIWQLDRLEQRKVFNTRVIAQVDAPVFEIDAGTVSSPFYDMEYRAVEVQGIYDFSGQVSLRNQVLNNRFGVHLFTPLLIEGTEQWVYVDRGWIPNEESDTESWGKFDETGEVLVQGVLRRSKAEADFGNIPDPTLAPGETRLDAYIHANLERMGEENGFEVLNVYIQRSPDETNSEMPIGTTTELDLTEGPHMGYALQWFTFGVILAVGYPFFCTQARSIKR